jgi:hypothetical protein
MIHVWIHEITRQRHQERLAGAERYRLARTVRDGMRRGGTDIARAPSQRSSLAPTQLDRLGLFRTPTERAR